MDPLTHMALGGALAHAVMSRRCRFALLAGAAGALLPDADVFLAGQGSSVAGYVLHRHFTHALVLIPVMQHQRALSAQRQLAESRGQTVERGRAIPLLGHMFAWRSVYQHDGVLHADAIRLLPFTAPRIRSGETVPILRIDDATLAHASPQAVLDLRLFAHFADGYIARTPGRPDLIGDMRYATPANSFRPLWAVRYDPADAEAEPALVHLAREDVRGRLRLLWRDIRGETRAIRQAKQAG